MTPPQQSVTTPPTKPVRLVRTWAISSVPIVTRRVITWQSVPNQRRIEVWVSTTPQKTNDSFSNLRVNEINMDNTQRGYSPTFRKNLCWLYSTQELYAQRSSHPRRKAMIVMSRSRAWPTNFILISSHDHILVFHLHYYIFSSLRHASSIESKDLVWASSRMLKQRRLLQDQCQAWIQWWWRERGFLDCYYEKPLERAMRKVVSRTASWMQNKPDSPRRQHQLQPSTILLNE